MKDISKLTKEGIEAFIQGALAVYQFGDTIDERKELEFIVTEIPSAWSIKAVWIKSVTRFPLVNPMTDKDDVYHYDDYYFQVLTCSSPRKLASEIVDCLDYVNSNEFNED